MQETEQAANSLVSETGPELDQGLCFLSIPEAAQRLNISRAKFYGLLNRDEIPSVRLGGRRLIFSEDLDAFIRALKARETDGATTASRTALAKRRAS